MRRFLPPKSFLAIVLSVDATLFLGFGLASYISPDSTYATIVDLSGVSDHSLMHALLDSLSIFYVVIGALCLLAAFMPPPYDVRVAVVMTAQHAWVGLKGLHELDRVWIVGNPWPDIIIHSLFVILYVLGTVRRIRR